MRNAGAAFSSMRTVLRQQSTSDLRNAASVQVACPACEEMSFTRIAGPPLERDQVDSGWSCPRCHARPSPAGPPPLTGRPVASCWICGTEEFYIQKDFNRQLGLFIVLVSAGLIFLVMLLTQDHLLGIGLLLGVALADWIVYRLIRNVTVCYLCHSLYRGFPQHPDHAGFYLGNEEKHKKLRKKWLEESVERALVDRPRPGQAE